MGYLQEIAVVPVTTEVGGTSQVKVTMVPSGLGNRLKSEIDGPGKRGIVSRERDKEMGGGVGGTLRLESFVASGIT